MDTMSNRSGSFEASIGDDKERLLYYNDSISSSSTIPTYPPPTPRRASRSIFTLLSLSLTTNIFLAFLSIYLLRHPIETDKSQILYTPARDAVEYHAITFTSGYLDDKSPYQSNGTVPDDAQDAAWRDLYHELIYSRIPRHQAAQLTNRTVPIPGDEGYYIAGLDVFHQLHCLVLLTPSPPRCPR